jgi:hypothetical protein
MFALKTSLTVSSLAFALFALFALGALGCANPVGESSTQTDDLSAGNANIALAKVGSFLETPNPECGRSLKLTKTDATRGTFAYANRACADGSGERANKRGTYEIQSRWLGLADPHVVLKTTVRVDLNEPGAPAPEEVETWDYRIETSASQGYDLVSETGGYRLRDAFEFGRGRLLELYMLNESLQNVGSFEERALPASTQRCARTLSLLGPIEVDKWLEGKFVLGKVACEQPGSDQGSDSAGTYKVIPAEGVSVLLQLTALNGGPIVSFKLVRTQDGDSTYRFESVDDPSYVLENRR